MNYESKSTQPPPARPAVARQTTYKWLYPVHTMRTSEKPLEVQASSEKSFEDALQRALRQASATHTDIRFLHIKKQGCRVQQHTITEYYLTAYINYEPMSQQPTNNGQQNDQATAAANEVTGKTTHHDESYIEAPEGVLSDYSDVEVDKKPMPEEHKPGSATSPENGGGYSG